jgi:Domain of unknown function (DUF397)
MQYQGAAWRKSSYSNGDGGACVEVADLPDGTHGVRDSQHRIGAVLAVTSDQWATFIRAVRTGALG